MAVSSILPSNRAVTAPEATRPSPDRARTVDDKPRNVEVAPNAAKPLSNRENEEAKRVSRENKDNGNDTLNLYQAPGFKQTLQQQQSRPAGTLVNVTA